jgi:hypothetical protein
VCLTEQQFFPWLTNASGMLLAAWSTNGWLPSGHAMRMALDLGLHRALEKLADDSENGKQRSEEEERNLGRLISSLWITRLIFVFQLFLPAFGSACIGLIISMSYDAFAPQITGVNEV